VPGRCWRGLGGRDLERAALDPAFPLGFEPRLDEREESAAVTDPEPRPECDLAVQQVGGMEAEGEEREAEQRPDDAQNRRAQPDPSPIAIRRELRSETLLANLLEYLSG